LTRQAIIVDKQNQKKKQKPQIKSSTKYLIINVSQQKSLNDCATEHRIYHRVASEYKKTIFLFLHRQKSTVQAVMEEMRTTKKPTNQILTKLNFRGLNDLLRLTVMMVVKRDFKLIYELKFLIA
jgi:hypothetical protein